ncbi:unnamed protein product, partial [Prorocentrum cordatum]
LLPPPAPWSRPGPPRWTSRGPRPVGWQWRLGISPCLLLPPLLLRPSPRPCCSALARAAAMIGGLAAGTGKVRNLFSSSGRDGAVELIEEEGCGGPRGTAPTDTSWLSFRRQPAEAADAAPADGPRAPGAGAAEAGTPWSQAQSVREQLQAELRREKPAPLSGDPPASPAAPAAEAAVACKERPRDRRKKEKKEREDKSPFTPVQSPQPEPAKALGGFDAAAPHAGALRPGAARSPLPEPARPFGGFAAAAPSVGLRPGAAPETGTSWAMSPTARAGPSPVAEEPSLWPAPASQFDEAILAALVALPAASLVGLLRRLWEKRPAEVAAAIGAPEKAEDQPARQSLKATGFEELQPWASGGAPADGAADAAWASRPPTPSAARARGEPG